MSGFENDILDSAFARSVARELANDRTSLNDWIETLARQRHDRLHLGQWLSTLGQVPFGRILHGAPTHADASLTGVSSALLESEFSTDSEGSQGTQQHGPVFSLGLAVRESHRDEELISLAVAGYDGACCPVGYADRSIIQYVTELGRELRMSPIWMIESDDDLALVLETDAPYFGFVYSENTLVEGFPYRPCDANALRGRLPKSTRAICFFEAPESVQRSFMVRMAQIGFDAYVDLASR